MRHMKKLVASMLVAVLALALGSAVALADNTTTSVSTATPKGSGEFSITMTGAEDGHVFKAYQVFDGSVDTSGKLGDISWANGFSTTGIAAELQAAGLTTTADGKTLDLSKAEDVATALAAQSDDSAVMKKVADVFYAHKGTAAGTVEAKTGDNYVISSLVAGYYLVTDEYKSTPAEGAATLSRNILAVVGDVTAQVKNTKPTVEKKILDPQPVDANKAGIGDTVAYQITGAVPNWEGYVNYFYVINDKLSSGLTFDGAQNLVVKVGDATLTQDTDYVVYTGEDAAPNTFQVAFKHIKNYPVGTTVTVTYTATVNENAAIGNPGNKNETDVIYSNNPNDSSDGNPEDNPKPTTDTPTGQSPKDTTVTYVAEVDLTKYADQVASGKELAGATFTLTGTANVVKGKGTDIYVPAENGAYWKLKDGSYTTQAPHGDIKDAKDNVKVESNEASYDSTTQKYALQHVTEYETATKNVFMQGTSGTDGKIVFKGLSAGTYTLTEVITPDGFNTVNPIEFTINITVPETITTGAETATFAVDPTTAGVSVDSTTGIYSTDVVDKSGSTLPSTGGMGTTILYVAGAIMVLVAGVYLITKRRASKESDL